MEKLPIVEDIVIDRKERFLTGVLPIILNQEGGKLVTIIGLIFVFLGGFLSPLNILVNTPLLLSSSYLIHIFYKCLLLVFYKFCKVVDISTNVIIYMTVHDFLLFCGLCEFRNVLCDDI